MPTCTQTQNGVVRGKHSQHTGKIHTNKIYTKKNIVIHHTRAHEFLQYSKKKPKFKQLIKITYNTTILTIMQ